jgi:hypothetical protein
MNGMVFIIAVASCLTSYCNFYYPAPDMPYTNYDQCKEDAQLFDFYLAFPYWTEVTCVEVPRVWVGHPVQKRW